MFAPFFMLKFDSCNFNLPVWWLVKKYMISFLLYSMNLLHSWGKHFLISTKQMNQKKEGFSTKNNKAQFLFYLNFFFFLCFSCFRFRQFYYSVHCTEEHEMQWMTKMQFPFLYLRFFFFFFLNFVFTSFVATFVLTNAPISFFNSFLFIKTIEYLLKKKKQTENYNCLRGTE